MLLRFGAVPAGAGWAELRIARSMSRWSGTFLNRINGLPTKCTPRSFPD
ncbi:hypothetical protein OCAR_4815 [Afipia carboxidovorans OM5]|nr:hypothetical protein OCAR_4815 [Afipia carboxidovorans OM5]